MQRVRRLRRVERTQELQPQRTHSSIYRFTLGPVNQLVVWLISSDKRNNNIESTPMSSVAKTRFAVKPLVAAVALAFAGGNAYAITANQMPGAGLVTAVSAGTTVTSSSCAACTTGGAIVNLTSSPTAAHVSLGGAVNPRAVIQWGGPGTGALGETTNPPGFNIGSGAQMNFETGAGIGAVLNVDASGSISQILGTLSGATIGGGSVGFTQLFVANANGVTVGASGRIIAPWGIGLIGADLTGSTAKYEFTRQNGAGTSFLDVATGQAPVIVGGVINGDAVANIPANYILLVGGDVTNTGNIFGAQVGIAAGIIAAPTTDTVNLVAKTTVNRLWNLDNPYGPGTAVNGNLGTAAGNVAIATASSSFVNTGTISSSNTNAPGNGPPPDAPTAPSIGVGSLPSYIGIQAANSIRSGTLGDTSQLIGLFSDGGIVTDTFNATGKTELYNVVEAYTIGNTLPFLNVNQETKAAGDVTINAILAGANPSTVTTTGPVNITGGAVAINSTINHKLDSAGGKQDDFDLNITGTKSVSITADIGAGANVNISSTGPLTISGNVLSDTDAGGNGGIYIYQYGTASGVTTTISGNLSTSKASYSAISVYNFGPVNSLVTIGGNVTTHNGAGIFVYSNGNYTQTGSLNGDFDVAVTVLGQTAWLQGPITAGIGGGNGEITFGAPFATTKIAPAAVLTAPQVLLGWDNFNGQWSGVGPFTGVNASGATYTGVAQKPAAQIVTDALVLVLNGNFNAPIAGNTNWLLNQIQIASLTPTTPMGISMSAVGAGFQAVNIGVTGDAMIDSGLTTTPFIGIPLTTGFFPAGGLIGNGGSQLIVNATGNLSIVGNAGAENRGRVCGPAFSCEDRPQTGPAQVLPVTLTSFQFPGGSTFKSGNLLSQFVPVYNAWTTIAQPFQGIFYEAPTIFAFSFDAVNGNSWVNFSTMPLNGAPTVYQIQQNTVPPALPSAFGFVPAPQAVHQNVYSALITGTPVNTCPVSICGWH